MERTTVNRRYRVDRRIGEGGMAEVYLGQDLLLNRAVVVKALRGQFAVDPVARARFEREAIAVAGLTHPNIVEIYDVGEAAGRPYLVMELVRGETLKSVVAQEGPFAPDDVAALLEQVGSALDYAHERGIVHRDVKPQNLLVTPDGVVKVVDFGIARDARDGHLTELGAGLGTVHYVSPEQANGLQASPSSDVYSLGVVAYEMLTGRLPFDADSPLAIALRHVHEPPRPPSTVFPHVPRQVDAILLRALEKDPARRFQSAGAFAEAMTRWREQPLPGTGRPIGPPPLQAMGAGGVSKPPVPPRQPEPQQVEEPWTARSAASALTHRPSAPPSLRPSVPPPRDGLGLTTWLVGSFGLVAIVALVWFVYGLSPRLAGGDDDGPRIAAEGDAGSFSASSGRADQSDSAPAGSETAAGQDVRPSDDAYLASSSNQPGSVPVPDLIGRSVAEATQLVTQRGLLIDDREPVFSEDVPPDKVAEQDPPADAMVAQGTTIVIKLSRGSASVSLADLDLVGLDAGEAERRLVSRGLGVERVDVGDRDVPAGRVVKVDPEGSATVGETVILYVSVGDRVEVPPEIQGRPLRDVERQLERAGLDVVASEALDREAIEAAGLENLDAAGIDPGDVVGFSDEDGAAGFGDWLPRGEEITLYYYDPTPDVGDDESS